MAPSPGPRRKGSIAPGATVRSHRFLGGLRQDELDSDRVARLTAARWVREARMILKYRYCPFAEDGQLHRMAGATMLAHNSNHRLDQFHAQLLTPASYLGVINRLQQPG